MARKKFTYKEHKERMLDIVNRPKQGDRQGIIKTLIEVARSKRARV